MVTTGGVAHHLPRGGALVLAVQAVAVALVAGWYATGHAGAPDGGLQQIDVVMLDERVPGVTAVEGRPTMLVVTCPGPPTPPRRLDPAYSLVVSTDARLAERLALPRAADCEAGYVLVDRDDRVRYRTYDPDWPAHAQEQEILLENLDGPHTLRGHGS